MKRLMAGVVFLLVSGMAHADMNSDYFLKMSNGTMLEKHSIEMYVGGVAKGYLNANGLLSAKSQPQLFCYDGDIDTKKAYELAMQAIKESKAVNTVEALLLMKLVRLYPC